MTTGVLSVPARPYDEGLIVSGQVTVPRIRVAQNVGAITTGVAVVSFFTAKQSFPSTQTRIPTGTTAAAATPTLCKLGLYTVAANGDLALVAITANDTTLFAAANTEYTRSWVSPYTLVLGQRYAYADMVISGAAIPSFQGPSLNLPAATLARAPRLCGTIAAVSSDLPTSVVAASISNNTRFHYAEVLP